MRPFIISEHLQEILKKVFRKNRILYEQIMNKIDEIVNCEDVEHYKNLKHNMKDSKRVHIGHFVLVFQYDKFQDSIQFMDFDHHDKIYSR